MKVVRVHGGHVFHVVHETKTALRRTTAFVICNTDLMDVALMRDGVPTCSNCIELDNPLKLSAHEKQVIRLLAEGHRLLGAKRQSVRRLIQLDLVREGSEDLTRRGFILGRDFTEGTAPWFDVRGVGHYREPLGYPTRCGLVAEFDKLTVERYAKMRKAGGVVTCLACLGLAR